jgi:hypothetical protein
MVKAGFKSLSIEEMLSAQGCFTTILLLLILLLNSHKSEIEVK